jgi:hypothetical protein
MPTYVCIFVSQLPLTSWTLTHKHAYVREAVLVGKIGIPHLMNTYYWKAFNEYISQATIRTFLRFRLDASRR